DALAGHDRRDDLPGEHLPGLGIAEERGDIDENGVEELTELLGMHLEVVAVLGNGLDIDLLHAPRDAALERGPLVDREVEAACGPEELEEALEIVVPSLLVVRALPVTHRRLRP